MAVAATIAAPAVVNQNSTVKSQTSLELRMEGGLAILSDILRVSFWPSSAPAPLPTGVLGSVTGIADMQFRRCRFSWLEAERVSEKVKFSALVTMDQDMRRADDRGGVVGSSLSVMVKERDDRISEGGGSASVGPPVEPSMSRSDVREDARAWTKHRVREVHDLVRG